MGEVVNLPKRPKEERAVTCGCGGQTFILVTGKDDQPDFVFCTECQYKQSKVNWLWTE